MTTERPEHVEARRVVEQIRRKLADKTATPKDHLSALEALLVLPTSEAEDLLSEFRRAFAVVVGRAREREQQEHEAPEVEQ